MHKVLCAVPESHSPSDSFSGANPSLPQTHTNPVKHLYSHVSASLNTEWEVSSQQLPLSGQLSRQLALRILGRVDLGLVVQLLAQLVHLLAECAGDGDGGELGEEPYAAGEDATVELLKEKTFG